MHKAVVKPPTPPPAMATLSGRPGRAGSPKDSKDSDKTDSADSLSDMRKTDEVVFRAALVVVGVDDAREGPWKTTASAVVAKNVTAKTKDFIVQ